MTTPPRTPTTAAGRALLTMNTPGPDAGQVSDFHSGYCDGLTVHECSYDLPFAILAIEAEARASLDVERLAVVAAARALRERLTIDPGNVVSWGEWDTLDEALAKLGAKP